MRPRLFAVVSAISLLLPCFVAVECRAENAPPDGADGFGCFYDETFVNTVVYARCGWMTFFYNYSGFDPMMPAPGWIQVNEPERGAKARAFVDALVAQKQSPQLDVEGAVSVALGQQMQTVVLFTAGGTKLEDFDDTLSRLHRETARLFVVWCAREKDDTKGQAQLKKLCELTGGAMIYAR